MRRATLALLTLFVLGSAAAWAQEATAPAGPPPVLLINREEIKPGHMSAHGKSAASYVSVLNRANADDFRLGLVPVSGDDNVVVYLTGYPSFAALEQGRQKFETALATQAALKTDMDAIERQGAEQHASQRTWIARYRSDLSYRPATMEQVAQARFMGVLSVRVKLGRAPDYVEYVKQLNAAREKAGVTDVSTAVYQVTSGAPIGFFLTFTVNKSLKEMDDGFARMEQRNKAIDEALGGPEVVKQRRVLLSEIVSDMTSALYAYDPQISRAAPQFAAADPEFWSPQPAAPVKALASKKAKKQ